MLAWLTVFLFAELAAALASTSTRYVILDSTQDSPSITGVLLALDASRSPQKDVQLLGVITTESSGLAVFENLFETTGLDATFELLSVEEQELYPIDDVDPNQLPETVSFLVEAVRKYPKQVVIYSTGSLAAVAMAMAADPDFAQNVAEVMVVATVPEEDNKIDGPSGLSFYPDSPLFRDLDALLAVMMGDIPMLRIIGTLKPVLSGVEIADAVVKAVKKDTKESSTPAALAQRPFAEFYVQSHRSRLMQGHEKAILLSEPGVAVLFDPSLITREVETEFDVHFEDENNPTSLVFRVLSLPEEKITPGDRSTLVASIDEDRFWQKLVDVRSKDWSAFAKEHVASAGKHSHDEL